MRLRRMKETVIVGQEKPVGIQGTVAGGKKAVRMTRKEGDYHRSCQS